MTDLEKSILATLAYFDIFEFPLASNEVKHYLVDVNFLNKEFMGKEERIKNQELRIKENLNKLINNKKIEQKDGFYFLPNREKIVEIRKERYNISLKKVKKARRVVWWLRFIPWIKAIFICSTLGLLNAEENADIDLLIITAKNRIWSARWWSAGVLKILNLRPKNNFIKDKFCLGHFITEDNLSLESTKIQEDDIHLIYLLSYYLPLYSEDDLWSKFIDANSWIKKYLPNFGYTCELGCELHANKHANFLIKPKLVWLEKLICQTQFGWEEKLYKKIQLKIMPEILKQMMNQDKRVIVNDKMIKLHSNDSRREVYEKWKNKISNF